MNREPFTMNHAPMKAAPSRVECAAFDPRKRHLHRQEVPPS